MLSKGIGAPPELVAIDLPQSRNRSDSPFVGHRRVRMSSFGLGAPTRAVA